MRGPSIEHRLRVARGLISGAAVSLEHTLSRPTEASLVCTLQQQAVWMIGKLEHAILQLKEASK